MTQKKNEEFDIPLYVVVVMLLAFVVLFYYVRPGGISPVSPASNQTQSLNMSGNIESFQASLLATDEMSIIMNVTGLDSNHSKYVYACGAGLAGSWGNLGKNISKLYLYVIEGDNCTYSSPTMSENQLSNATSSSTAAGCMTDAANRVSFEITYGPGYSIFTERKAYIFVDEKFDQECSFRTSSAGSVITSQATLPTNTTQ